ncbi:Ubiquitin--protein ligase [Bertholletia excelsa]
MAEVSYLHLHEDDEEDHGDDVVVTLDSVPYWAHDMDSFDAFASDVEFSPSFLSLSIGPQITSLPRRGPDRRRGRDELSEGDSIASIDPFDRENQVNFVMDLFHQRVEQSSIAGEVDLVSAGENLDPDLGVIEGNEDMVSSNLELDLGLGLGLFIDRHGLDQDGSDDHNCGFMVADRGDEFFLSRRDSVSESGESTVGSGGELFPGGLRVVEISSDSGEEEHEDLGIDLNGDDDVGLENACDDDTTVTQLCWEHRDASEDFEWEEVDGRVEEREVLSMFFDADVDEDLDSSVVATVPSPSEEEISVETVTEMRHLEWEVLLNVHNLEMNVDLGHDAEPYLADLSEYNYAAEYEMLFGQFAENENSIMGKPPASKTVVENLPSVVLTQEDVDNNNGLCAVCKDEMKIGEQAKRLPCSHRYHGDCIVPWLGIRNTCPVCRFELPTDNPDYERRRTRRAGGVH